MTYKLIEEFPDYEISEEGKIRRCGKLRHMKWKQDKDGYFIIGLYKDGRQLFRRRNRLVARAFLGEPEATQVCVRHLDGTKTNDHWRNLAYGTIQDNANDAIKHGGIAKGDRNGTSKLCNAIILQIRHNTTSSQQEIADEYGISQTQVSAIKKGKAWKHVGGPINTESRFKQARSNRALDEAAVRDIRKRSDERAVDLAKEYGVSASVISGIRCGITYAWVK